MKETNKTKINKEDKLIISPRITEKASLQSNVNAYTFIVSKNATKHSVASEIKKTYKVTPKSVNITNIPAQYTFIRGKQGRTSGLKKAIVFLKKGDTINLTN